MNSETYVHPPNNLRRRVVNNNLHLHLPKGAEIKNDTVNTSQQRTTKFVTNDTERQRSFVSRKDTILEKDDVPSNESKRSQHQRKLELGDDSDTEDNGLSPVKIQKTNKATKGDIMHTQMGSGIETDIEVNETYCNICETTDDNDTRGPWVVCEYKHEGFHCCVYTAHLLCLDLHEYPPYFLCPEHCTKQTLQIVANCHICTYAKDIRKVTTIEDDDSMHMNIYERNNKDDKENANPKPQIWEDDENVLQHTNRVTHLHQHNYSDHRVVNNNLFLNSPKADVIKRNVAITRKPRTTEYIMNDTERIRCFDSRKVTLFKKADEVKTKTGCDIYLEMRYERKPHIYKSEIFQNYSLKQEDMDVDSPDESRRSNNKLIGKRSNESEDDSDTEDNKLSPAKIPKTLKEHTNSGNRDQTENEMETEADKCVCNICGEYEDDNDEDKGPWVNCAYHYEGLSCKYTAHVTCLKLEEYPQHFICSEHKAHVE